MRVAAIGLGVLVVVLGSGAAFAAGGGGAPSGGGSFNMPEREKTPEEQAKSAYNQGIRAVKAADNLRNPPKKPPTTRRRPRPRTRRTAVRERARLFRGSAATQGRHVQAWKYVGYTSRKLGDYDKALLSYDQALRLNPSYNEAIEYRGVAYLGLDRVDDARTPTCSCSRAHVRSPIS